MKKRCTEPCTITLTTAWGGPTMSATLSGEEFDELGKRANARKPKHGPLTEGQQSAQGIFDAFVKRSLGGTR